MDILRAFVSWSGGKDSALAFYKAMTNRIQVMYFVNMISDNGLYCRSHGISSELLKIQAEAIGIPIIQIKTTWDTYEEEFKKRIFELKKQDITVGVFGDIDIEQHREWIERVCRETGIKAILPLWHQNREKLLKEFIDLGFKAIVCSTNSEFLGKEWLGRLIDYQFIKDLKDLGNIDLCGEKGEYHTFVFDGPVFKKSVKILSTHKFMKDKKWFLKIERSRLC